ncbi:hypothetical protein [Saccharomonospora iraqiensis]|uniref:hypothetical protein n=1 Tax=Saccharomonospora iraqiensis TaxID=52698 RepID=UPI00022E0EAC|nr:hypothetical protein [Saccharomonospora iraqiensis]
MAIRIKLGRYRTVHGDPLGRSCVGYFPGMSPEDVWQAGRGVWKLDRRRAEREGYALLVGGELVRAVADIAALVEHGDRVELVGKLVGPGESLHDAYVGSLDPVVRPSRNPVAYVALPEEP